MELRVLQYFLAVAREQSIIRAAESLHLSQPTLSTQIKNMEEELGKQLLIRGSKGSRKVTLTEEGIRLLARTAGKLRIEYPGIHYHISSGNYNYVTENLDKGLLDFGLVFGNPDLKKYDSLQLPVKDIWGVLMKSNDPLAEKTSILPEDLWDKPLMLSQEQSDGGPLIQWIKKSRDSLNITVAYNLLFNASLFVEEDLGYAVCFDRIINTSGNSSLTFRPLNPPLQAEMHLIWKKYQIFSKPAEKFLDALKADIL